MHLPVLYMTVTFPGKLLIRPLKNLSQTNIMISGQNKTKLKKAATPKGGLYMEPKLGNPQNTIAIIQKYNFVFQKKYGQNFLIDTHVLDKIISAAGITNNDMVLEIGPGIGTMTQYLASAARKVIAVEIDDHLIPILEDTLSEYDNVTILHDDILKVNITHLASQYNGGRPIKVVANLPYYITTPIIMGLFEKDVPVDNITVMVQKEVADRMQVGPGSKDYGALSLAVQYYAEPYLVANVPPNCFLPRPKIRDGQPGEKAAQRPAAKLMRRRIRICAPNHAGRRRSLVQYQKLQEHTDCAKQQRPCKELQDCKMILLIGNQKKGSDQQYDRKHICQQAKQAKQNMARPIPDFPAEPKIACEQQNGHCH